MVLINPSEACENARENETVTIIPEETAIVGIFLAQLRLLLGIPETVITTSLYILYYNSILSNKYGK